MGAVVRMVLGEVVMVNAGMGLVAVYAYEVRTSVGGGLPRTLTLF